MADRTDTGGSVSRSDLASVARGGLLNLVGTVLGAACSFVLVIIVTRGLGAATTGIFFESVALFSILGTLSTWGSEVGVVRTIPMYRTLGRDADVRHAVRAALIPVAVAGTVFAIVMAVFAAPLGSLLTNGRHGADLAPVVRILAPFLPIYAVYTVALALTRGFGSMVPSNVIDKLGRSVAQPVFVFAVIAAGLSSSAIALAWAVPYGFALGVALLWVGVLMNRSQQQPIEARKQAALHVWREFWMFASARGLAGVFSVMILWLGTLLIGALQSSAAAGIYAAATRFLTFGQLIGIAVTQVVGPKLSELLSRGDRERTRTVYATSTWWLIAFSWPLYLTMIVMAPALLSIFGPGYQQAQGVLVILGASMLFATAVGTVDIVLLMAGKSSWNLLNAAVAVITNVALNLVLIPRYGIVGAAAALAASIFLNNFLPLIQVWKILRVHPFGRGTIASAGASLVCFGGLMLVFRLVWGPSLSTLFVGGIGCSLVYLVLLWRLRRVLHLSAFGEALRRRGASPAPEAPAL